MSERFWNNLTSVIAVLVLLLVLCAKSKAEDGDYVGPKGFHVAFALSGETLAQEVSWQALNVVDYQQSLKIAEHPDQFQEIGTPSIFGVSHPTKSQVLYFSVGFAVAHYAVTRGIESLVDRNPDYRVLQRVWQYTMLAGKAYTVENNHHIGMGW